MTLTEEQLEAIRAVSDLPRAIGCTRCHNYIQKNYSNQFAVLRSMIDNKDYVPNAAELIELLAAGEHEQWADWAQSILDSEPGLSEGRKAAWPGMIATPYENLSEELKDKDRREVHLRSSVALDIVQQQAARIKSLKKEIRRLKHESKVEQEFTNSYIKRLHDAEARIKELGSSLDEAEALTKQNAELMNGYLGRIAELEDALVEGLTNFLHYRASCYDPARRCPYAKECDDCSTWDACGHVEKFRSEARRQLQAEGKIGPDAKPRSWQITDERKAAIGRAIESVVAADSDSEEQESEDVYTWRVLRAMLREAE